MNRLTKWEGIWNDGLPHAALIQHEGPFASILQPALRKLALWEDAEELGLLWVPNDAEKALVVKIVELLKDRSLLMEENAAMRKKIEEHKVEEVLLQKQIALLKKMYLESEKARKDLTEKLSAAQELLDAAEERERERYETPSVACGDTSLKEGGKEGGEGA